MTGRVTSRCARIAAAAAFAGIATAAPAATAGFSDGFPDLRVSMTGPPGPIPKGQTATYVATVTNQGTGPAGQSDSVSLSSYRVNGERPVPNPYRSVESSLGGSCEMENFPSKFGTYYGAKCPLAGLAAGSSAQVTAVVEINESMDHNAFVGGYTGGSSTVTTLVDTPPVVTGSKKIKVGGLPDGCASKDFTMTAKAKGAKKMQATLRGPLSSEGKPEHGEFSKTRNLASATGAKLRAPIDVDKLEAAFYEIKLAAKYEDKPKQQAGVLFQSCA